MHNIPEGPLDPKEEAICDAAYEGDVAELQRLIALGYPLVSEEHGSPMDFAASEGEDEAVKLLHAAGAPVNGRNDDGYPVYWAVVNQRASTLSLLCYLGADINACECEAVKEAVNCNDLDIMKIVVEVGGDLDVAVTQAKQEENKEMEQYLWGQIALRDKDDRAVGIYPKHI